MTNLAEKLNISTTSEDNKLVFCARNLTEVFSCQPEYIEEALNDAGYYAEDGDYTNDDLLLLCEVVDDFASAEMLTDSVIDKCIWFDAK